MSILYYYRSFEFPPVYLRIFKYSHVKSSSQHLTISTGALVYRYVINLGALGFEVFVVLPIFVHNLQKIISYHNNPWFTNTEKKLCIILIIRVILAENHTNLTSNCSNPCTIITREINNNSALPRTDQNQPIKFIVKIDIRTLTRDLCIKGL